MPDVCISPIEMLKQQEIKKQRVRKKNEYRCQYYIVGEPVAVIAWDTDCEIITVVSNWKKYAINNKVNRDYFST